MCVYVCVRVSVCVCVGGGGERFFLGGCRGGGESITQLISQSVSVLFYVFTAR